MRNTIAVMNTTGGVGKSTLVLSVAETLSAQFGKNVLIIDSSKIGRVKPAFFAATDAFDVIYTENGAWFAEEAA